MANNKYLQHFNQRETSQNEAIPGTKQVPNAGGGYSWLADDWTRLDRFLILGTEAGTYYTTEQKLTIDNAEAVMRCLQEDPERTVNRIAELSTSGRAAKQDPAIFALAMAASVEAAKPHVARVFNDVIRIGTHLFMFCEMVQGFRGWGRGLQKLVGGWYYGRPLEQMAYQVVKYPQRKGWSHRDVLRLTHIAPVERDGKHEVVGGRIVSPHDKLFNWVALTQGGRVEKVEDGKSSRTPDWNFQTGIPLLDAMNELKACQTANEAAKLIPQYRLPREAVEQVNTEWLNEPAVWEALLQDMPMGALLRNLARMTASGFLQPMSNQVKRIVEQFADVDRVHKARIHPISVLSAMKVYAQGHGERGKLTWDPIGAVVDSLDQLFYAAFENVEPTGKRRLVALDVSSSMIGNPVHGIPGLDARTASAAMALVTITREPNYVIVGFTAGGHSYEDGIMELKISPMQRLDDVVEYIHGVGFGATDCSLPMRWALQRKLHTDSFEIWTDSETNTGHMHPSQALVQYRQKTGIAAKAVVCAACSNGFTIADPNDKGMLDVVGFDAAVPGLLAAFITDQL